jgi:hypothetical protein
VPKTQNHAMTLSELLATIESLSHADKFRLVQIVLQQLAVEDGVNLPPFSPYNGATSPLSSQAVLKSKSFVQWLLEIPDVGLDEDFLRVDDLGEVGDVFN